MMRTKHSSAQSCTHHQRAVQQAGITALLPLLLLTVLLCLLSACSTDEGDVMARFRPAMRPAFQSDLDNLANLPRYAINVELLPNANQLTGNLTVRFVNTSADPWPYVVFRLYPALKQYGGLMTIYSTNVDGRVVPFSYQAHNSAMLVQYPDFLRAGATSTIQISWKLDIPPWPDSSNVYALFGRSQGMYTLPLFYPSLAVYQPAQGVKGGEWWLDEGSVRGDATFNLASLFVVTATMPADQVPVTSGTLVTSTLVADQKARHVWVTGPSREFLLHTSSQFSSAMIEANGTRVTSYWLPGQEAMGRAALNYTIAALRIYSDNFGAYPYRDLRVAPAPLYFRGMEYPQVSLIGVDNYGRNQGELEMLVAHEVAHQWWYQIVHNDPVNEPWLDEALAEYSMKLYLEQLRGGGSASRLQTSRWDEPVKELKSTGDAVLINQTVKEFASGSLYETIVYGKGALFYDAIRETLGDRRFVRFLQQYFAAHRYAIVNTEDWLAAVHELNTPALEVLYEEWVRRPQPSLNPTATPVADDTATPAVGDTATKP